MNEQQLSVEAIESVLTSQNAYCKFLSANDSGETGGHQSGILVSRKAKEIMFPTQVLMNAHILKRTVKIRWQNSFETESCFTWYSSKRELRITKFGRGFPLLQPQYTGALFVLSNKDDAFYDGFVLNTEDGIQNFLDAFGLTPAETNDLIQFNKAFRVGRSQYVELNTLLSDDDFPTSVEISSLARARFTSHLYARMIITDPDKMLALWTAQEYHLFKALEAQKYFSIISTGFSSIDDFIVLANQVLNRRKSRAGRSLELHLTALFDGNALRYSAQAVTEGNKKPDFIFPSIAEYHDSLFSIEKLCTLAAKTTCKDRWRQILNEADRLRDQNKYLCTLQQGISSTQMDEMEKERVILVVPKQYIPTYPKEKQDRIWSIARFIQYVRTIEGLN